MKQTDVLIFCDKQTGLRRFQVEVNGDAEKAVGHAASLLALGCMARGELPQDYAICVPAHDTLIDRITRDAEDLLHLGRNLSCSVAMSPRESEVLKELMRNRGNKEIADRLNISVRTVKFHVSSLLCKFGVGSRWDLIQKAGRILGNQELGQELRNFAPRNSSNRIAPNGQAVPMSGYDERKQNRVVAIRGRLHSA